MERSILLTTALLLTLILPLSAHSQAIDDNDIGVFFGSYPETGSWFAMDGSNTGFFFDIQNGIAAGAYFGFNDDGENVWLLFTGPLQRPDDAQSPTDWTLQAPLTQGANGGCILDCSGAMNPPASSTPVGEITINFSGRGSAAFSVDGSSFTDIVPLYFGTPAIGAQVPEGLFVQPDLEGTWVVSQGSLITNTEDEILQLNLADIAGVIRIGEQTIRTPGDGGPALAEGVTRFTRAPISNLSGVLFRDATDLICVYFEPTATSPSIECTVEGGITGVPPQGFLIFAETKVQLLSDSRFLLTITSDAPPESGIFPPLIRLEGFRLGYD